MFIYRFAATVFLIVAAISCFAQDYTIKGRVKGIDTGWAYIRHRQRPGTDSGKIVSGNFVITGKAENPEFCSFGLSIKGIKDYYLGLFLEPKHMTFSVDTALLDDIGIHIAGSNAELQFQQFQAMVAIVKKLNVTQIDLTEKLEQVSGRYALEHRGSFISAFAIFSYEMDLDKLSKLFNFLTPTVRQSYFGRKIAQKLNSQ